MNGRSGSDPTDLARVLDDFEALAPDRIFDLSGGLGDDLLDAVVSGIADHFDHEVDADGVPWPELSSDYARAKQRIYPGAPILVREGTLRDGIEGQRTIAPDSAIYTFGVGDVDRAEADWMEQGDPAANRPPRKFVDLTPEAIAASDHLFDRAFDERTPR